MVSRKHSYVEELEARFIRDIRYGRATSRLELARRHQLAPSTAGVYVDRLLANGYLLEQADERPLLQRRGRPMQSLGLRGEAGCFVGADFEARHIHAVCADFRGNVLRRYHVDVPAGAHADDVLQALRAAIRQVLAEINHPLLGIGVGVPGLVDSQAGIARHYRFIENWNDVAISRYLEESFRVPIVIENTVRATAMGIMLFEPDRKLQNFACILVRSGVGAGVVAKGELKQGVHNTASEVGRIMLPDNGATPPRSIEDEASLSALVAYVGERLAGRPDRALHALTHPLAVEDIFRAAQAGDSLAVEALERTIDKIGWLAHVLALVEDPETIVLAGPLTEMGEWLQARLTASLARYAPTLINRPPILLSKLGKESGALGSVSLACDRWKPTRPAKALAEA